MSQWVGACPFGCTVTISSKKLLQEHLQRTCPTVRVACPAQLCGCEEIPRWQLTDHLAMHVKYSEDRICSLESTVHDLCLEVRSLHRQLARARQLPTPAEYVSPLARPSLIAQRSEPLKNGSHKTLSDDLSSTDDAYKAVDVDDMTELPGTPGYGKLTLEDVEDAGRGVSTTSSNGGDDTAMNKQRPKAQSDADTLAYGSMSMDDFDTLPSQQPLGARARSDNSHSRSTSLNTQPTVGTVAAIRPSAPTKKPPAYKIGHISDVGSSVGSRSDDSRSTAVVTNSELEIERLPCFGDVNRMQALHMLSVSQGDYIFRWCSDPQEKVNGEKNPNLFVLSFMVGDQMKNVKVYRFSDGLSLTRDHSTGLYPTRSALVDFVVGPHKQPVTVTVTNKRAK